MVGTKLLVVGNDDDVIMSIISGGSMYCVVGDGAHQHQVWHTSAPALPHESAFPDAARASTDHPPILLAYPQTGPCLLLGWPRHWAGHERRRH